jgi:hypothetical protein
MHGLGVPPTSFLRRAARPEELFLTTPFVRGQALSARLLGAD